MVPAATVPMAVPTMMTLTTVPKMVQAATVPMTAPTMTTLTTVPTQMVPAATMPMTAPTMTTTTTVPTQMVPAAPGPTTMQVTTLPSGNLSTGDRNSNFMGLKLRSALMASAGGDCWRWQQ